MNSRLILGRKTPIRSLKPRLVVQEIYGWLLGHYAVRYLMFTAASTQECLPCALVCETLTFVGNEFQDLQPEQLLFLPKLIMDIAVEKFSAW